ncbi:MAG: transposase [Clostridia bacterium]|nr:transposase [Clostridia bacterium]
MKRTYSSEFKIKACELVLKEGIKHAVVAEKLGINKIMLYRWIDEYETYGGEAFVGKGHLRAEDAELRKLRKENERLRMENEILKKAAAYFAKDRGGE